jgi:hypothetical protein
MVVLNLEATSIAVLLFVTCFQLSSTPIMHLCTDLCMFSCSCSSSSRPRRWYLASWVNKAKKTLFTGPSTYIKVTPISCRYLQENYNNDSGSDAFERVLPLINPIYWIHAGGLALLHPNEVMIVDTLAL